MGFISCVGACFVCKKMMTFHPNKVPSFKGEPICKTCVDFINEKRKANGLPPITYSSDAYEGADENEIDFGSE